MIIPNDSNLTNNLDITNLKVDVFDSAPLGVVITKDGIILYINKLMLKLYGYYTKSALIGSHISKIQPKFLRNKMQKRVQKRVKGIFQPNSYDSMGLRKDGTHFPIKIDVSRIEVDNSYAILSFITDLSKQIKKARNQILSETNLRHMLKISPIGLCIIQDEKIILANDSFKELHEYIEDGDIQKTNPKDLLVPEMADQTLSKIYLHNQTDYDNNSIKSIALTKNGNQIPIAITYSNIEFENGNAVILFVSKY